MVNRTYIFLVALIAIILDQITKALIWGKLATGENILIIKKILSVTKIYNTGAAFSLFQEHTIFLTIFSILVTIGIVVYFIKKKTPIPIIPIIGWGLILGGTVGNLIDRIRLGYVIDFIRLEFVNFPIFNIADLCINIGALLIILHSFRHIEKRDDT